MAVGSGVKGELKENPTSVPFLLVAEEMSRQRQAGAGLGCRHEGLSFLWEGHRSADVLPTTQQETG